MKEKHSTLSDRVDWLVNHPEVWTHLLNLLEKDKKKYHFSFERHLLFNRMRDAGLFAKSTYWRDVQLVDELITANKLLNGVKANGF